MKSSPSAEVTPASRLPASFAWLNTAQFLGAFNDNVLKLLIIFFLIGGAATADAGTVAARAAMLYVVPFLLFSAAAGSLADRCRKRSVVVAIKVMEVVVTLLGCVSFLAGSTGGLYAVVFLMGSHSALFAPSKYGMVPELVERERLSQANSFLESFTFLAIILGTAAASLLVQLSGSRYGAASLFCVIVAICGVASALRIAPTPLPLAPRPFSPLPAEILRALQGIRGDGYLLLAVIGAAYFMFLGAFCQLNLITYGMEQLGLSQAESGYLFLAAALGIGAGSLLAGRLSGRNVEFGVVPIGALGLTVAAFLIHGLPTRLVLIVPTITLFGISAGLFIVPLQSFIQLRSPRERLGEILAASGFLSWVGVLLASGLTILLSGVLGFSAPQSFSVVGILTLILSLITLRVLPDFLLRFLALLAMRICYRIRSVNERVVPTEGPALLIANHVSWLDALLLIATQQRRIRFIMDRDIYNTPVLKQLCRLMQVIPVSSRDGRKGLVEFMATARAALDEGYLVCIFAEGAITRSGMLGEFKGGFERIVRGSDYPIIPVYIGGAWGSILSYAHGRLLSRWPTLFPYRMTIIFGEPLPATTTAEQVRQAVMELSCAWFDSRKPRRRSLAELFVEAARGNWRQHAISDSGGKNLSYGEALTGALLLAGKFDRLTAGQDKVGLLLPPSAGGALANIAVTLLGRVPVNLNYTASAAGIRSAIEQCGIRTIITSHAFLEKLGSLPQLEGMFHLEDILGTVTAAEKRNAFLKALLLPRRMLTRSTGFDADRVATIIFSSGSTGEPKGVMLSHHNIQSNLEALRMVFRVSPNDNICSALPFFHSLGFTGTLWLPLVSGFSAAYHPNPLDGETIARIVRERRSTLLIATPTFLMAYLRRAKKEDFASLRLVITGAEKLKPRVADAFQEKFGIRPLEGYGATELSPVITLSLPDMEIDGVRQKGGKEGSVGHPIPGVAIKVVDPENCAPLAPGSAGLILVKGPNVMLGYLNNPQKTAEVVRDGWYVTGDIGILDQDGFLRITDRLSRFSKIGGEMVPHGAVEDELHTRLGQQQVVAVTAIPDEKRGEKLAVIYVQEQTDGETLYRLLADSTLPNLWKPGKECYVPVEALPILGTGKLDLKGIRELALAALGGEG